MRLAGKVALITGAASGIGLAMARAFATEGAVVAIADLDGNESEGEARKIEEETGSRCFGLAMDVTSEDAVQQGVDTIVQRTGPVDILVNNAGIQFISRIEELAFRDWRRVMAVHLDGAFLTTRACLPHMYASGKGGTILYMGSIHSKMASVLKGPYVAAKHGILGLCRVVAKEGAAHGVRANVICPSYVRTPLVERQIPEQAQRLQLTEAEVVKNIFLRDSVDGEFTTTGEIAEAAIFLAAQKTLCLTGQSLIVGHGWVME